MSFLDRFKSQPKWKHADAAVRAAAVNELALDDPEQQRALIELAGDEDIRVRRAAHARIDSVEDLVRLSRSEQDEDAKRGLIDRLVEVATAPADSDGDAALALSGLDDEKAAGHRGQELAARNGADRGARARPRHPQPGQHRAARQPIRRPRSRPSPVSPIRRSSSTSPSRRTTRTPGSPPSNGS